MSKAFLRSINISHDYDLNRQPVNQTRTFDHAKIGKNIALHPFDLKLGSVTVHEISQSLAHIHRSGLDIYLMPNIYTLFDGLAYNTCGYFASCVVLIRAMSKMSARIIC